MEFIGNICIVALLSYGGYLVMQNQLNPGELVAFFSLVNYMMWPIMNLGFVINMFSQAKASGERLLDILEKEEDITDHPHALHKQKLTGDVHFKNVSLAYGKEQTNALCNVSFEANSGKVIGLLGPTGSGKSSVTQLLTRFYSPVSGMITIDHKPITDYSLKTFVPISGSYFKNPSCFHLRLDQIFVWAAGCLNGRRHRSGKKGAGS